MDVMMQLQKILPSGTPAVGRGEGGEDLIEREERSQEEWSDNPQV
jgi:hypothetical protein